MSYGHAEIGRHGLLNADRVALEHIKRNVLRAAALGHEHRQEIHYTQQPPRWEYIASHCRAYRGEYPRYADCSAYVTGLLWDATRRYPAARVDFVNGLKWTSGHTGTLVTKGVEIASTRTAALSRLRIMDLVFYGDEGWRPGHVAISIGNGMVFSHGSEGGPYVLPVRYRSDVAVGGWLPRRYVH